MVIASIKNVDKDFDPTVTVGANVVNHKRDENVKLDSVKVTQVSFLHSGEFAREEK